MSVEVSVGFLRNYIHQTDTYHEKIWMTVSWYSVTISQNPLPRTPNPFISPKTGGPRTTCICISPIHDSVSYIEVTYLVFQVLMTSFCLRGKTRHDISWTYKRYQNVKSHLLSSRFTVHGKNRGYTQDVHQKCTYNVTVSEAGWRGEGTHGQAAACLCSLCAIQSFILKK